MQLQLQKVEGYKKKRARVVCAAFFFRDWSENKRCRGRAGAKRHEGGDERRCCTDRRRRHKRGGGRRWGTRLLRAGGHRTPRLCSRAAQGQGTAHEEPRLQCHRLDMGVSTPISKGSDHHALAKGSGPTASHSSQLLNKAARDQRRIGLHRTMLGEMSTCWGQCQGLRFRRSHLRRSRWKWARLVATTLIHQGQ